MFFSLNTQKLLNAMSFPICYVYCFLSFPPLWHTFHECYYFVSSIHQCALCSCNTPCCLVCVNICAMCEECNVTMFWDPEVYLHWRISQGVTSESEFPTCMAWEKQLFAYTQETEESERSKPQMLFSTLHPSHTVWQIYRNLMGWQWGCRLWQDQCLGPWDLASDCLKSLIPLPCTIEGFGPLPASSSYL